MTIVDAQQDLRRAYVGGGPGVLVSAAVWLAAAVVRRADGTGAGFAVLFLGGMLIFPGATLACRIVFRRADELSGNPLGGTALESTIAMIGGLFAAWLFLEPGPALAFPLAAVAVGTHYLVFRTVYGDRAYWLLGGLVAATGLADICLSQLRGSTAALVAVTEFVFGIVLTMRATRPGGPAATAASRGRRGVGRDA